jgi:hypothetical protein
MQSGYMFTVAQLLNQPKCSSVNEWIKEMCYVYTKEYFLFIKRKEILLFEMTWMNL